MKRQNQSENSKAGFIFHCVFNECFKCDNGCKNLYLPVMLKRRWISKKWTSDSESATPNCPILKFSVNSEDVGRNPNLLPSPPSGGRGRKCHFFAYIPFLWSDFGKPHIVRRVSTSSISWCGLECQSCSVGEVIREKHVFESN